MVTALPSSAARATEMSTGSAPGVGLGLGLGVALIPGLGLDVALGDGLAVALTVGIGVELGGNDTKGVAVGDGSSGLGVGADARFWGSGTARSAKSVALSSVSCVEPRPPPGRRSMLEPAAGAGALLPSRQV